MTKHDGALSALSALALLVTLSSGHTMRGARDALKTPRYDDYFASMRTYTQLTLLPLIGMPPGGHLIWAMTR